MDLRDYLMQQPNGGQMDLASYIAALQQANTNENTNTNENSNSDSIADYLSANNGNMMGVQGTDTLAGGASNDQDEDMLNAAVGLNLGEGNTAPSPVPNNQGDDTLAGGIGSDMANNAPSSNALPANLAAYGQQLNNYSQGKPIDYNQVIASRMPSAYTHPTYHDMSTEERRNYNNLLIQNMIASGGKSIKGVSGPAEGAISSQILADTNTQMGNMYDARQKGIQSGLTGATSFAENAAKNQIEQKRMEAEVERAKNSQEYGLILKDANGNPVGMVDRRHPSAPPVMFSGIPQYEDASSSAVRHVPPPSAEANRKVLKGIDATLGNDPTDSDNLPLDETQKRQILKKANEMYQQGLATTPDDAVTTILDNLGGKDALQIQKVPGAIWGNVWQSNGKNRYFPNLNDYLQGGTSAAPAQSNGVPQETTGILNGLNTSLAGAAGAPQQAPQVRPSIQGDLSSSGGSSSVPPQPNASAMPSKTNAASIPSQNTPSGTYNYKGKSISKNEAEALYADAQSKVDENGHPLYSPEVLAQIRNSMGL